MLLSDIHGPDDLKRCSREELETIASEIRERIIETVSHNGGHLASNLGMVELTLALHRAFDFSRDRLVLDVGHQCYAHKLLTGRGEAFATLRCFDGLSGFPRRGESGYDAFDTGHASTAISAAVGMARARDALGEGRQVVAVVGDGALTGGMCYEALNDAGSSRLHLIVVLNDNGMSISRNVGAISRYLTHLRASKGWNDAKRRVKRRLKGLPVIGTRLYRVFRRVKNFVRDIFIQDQLFDALGFRYLGPVDGGDVEELERLLCRAKDMDGPVLLHVITRKGRGYGQAEDDPTRMHGTPPFDVDTGLPLAAGAASMSRTAGEELCGLAERDARVMAVTAAMTDGTGLSAFARRYPGRLFDVGIAEEHAVTMAAGMACGGLRPFVAIYDTFLQRAYDQLLHDVCLQGLPVCFLVDRAGLSEDGVTHHGIYGLSYLSSLPGMTVLCASSRAELRAMMRYALRCSAPVAIRYGKTDCGGEEGEKGDYKPVWECLRQGSSAAILAVGALVREALLASDILARQGIGCAVYNASCVCPLDEDALRALEQAGTPLVTVEEGCLQGGFGGAVARWGAQNGCRVLTIGLTGVCATQGDRARQLAFYGLDGASIARRVQTWLEEKNNENAR